MDKHGRVSVLAITAAPDDRDTTRILDDVIGLIDARSSCRAELWYLRSALNQASPRGARIVDSLRTWLPAVALERIGLPAAAARLRGLRLRWWLRRLDPDVVLLDDALGARVLGNRIEHTSVVVRYNKFPPDTASQEVTYDGIPNLTIINAERLFDDPDDGRAILYEYPLDCSEGSKFAEPASYRRTRLDLGLPTDEPLVIGHGNDGWLDGPELFIRTLWVLHYRHGIKAHGAWFGRMVDEHESTMLIQEADRMGLGGYYHHYEDDSIQNRLCGDVLLLTCRAATTTDTAGWSVASGMGVVAFAACEVRFPTASIVADLDVEAAATELASLLATSRDKRFKSLRDHFDQGIFTDRSVIADSVASTACQSATIATGRRD